MDYKGRWKIIKELGEGGQGKVYCALDIEKFNVEKRLYPDLKTSLQSLATGISLEDERRKMFNLFSKTIADLIRMEDPSSLGALKVLLNPKDARDSKLAGARINREIEAMDKFTHPNLLKILDFDPDSKWFVSQFHPRGTLDKYPKLFVGDFVKALRAFRPLVEGVSELHKSGLVHRDIKPHNIFLDADSTLILGDFGLIFFTDKEHSRISATFENVGTRDWMPPWAYSMRVEEVKPTFDVFSLAKVLWSMVSGLPVLRLWYFKDKRFNLEELFPKAPYIWFANQLFKKCICEHEEDCLSDATNLLEEIDKILFIIDSNADLIGPNIKRRCRVCGIGDYGLIVDSNSVYDAQNFGLNPRGATTFKIFYCNHCGHVQLFFFPGEEKVPPAWEDEKAKMDRKLKAQIPH